MEYHPRAQALLEMRAYEIGMVASRQPFKMLPIECALIPEIYPLGPVPRLQNMVFRYNMDQFDRLSQKGYKLNLLEGEYEKTESRNA